MQNQPSQNTVPKKKPIWKMKRFLIPVILFVLFVLIGATSGEPKNPNQSQTNSSQNQSQVSSQKPTEPVKPKEGDVISGISRKEIDDTWKIENDKSKLKADNYLKTLTDKEVVWIAKVENVDTNAVNNLPYINMKMGNYTVRAYDKEGKYSDLEKGNLVKITGKIESVFSFIGLDVYLAPTSIEKL